MIGTRIGLERKRWIAAALLLAAAAILAPGTGAQDVPATPASPVALAGPAAITGIFDADGNQVGTASFITTETGVDVTINVEGLSPGEHGIHIHDVGICDPTTEEPFSSAEGHFNPNNVHHGAPNLATPAATPSESDAHAGDLGNIEVGDEGIGLKTFSTDLFSLVANQPDSLNDMNGSAIVIHADPDDLTTDPSGNSGERIACGVIFGPMTAVVPLSTPQATPTS